ncbi:WxL domain-containing protein [Enterococcus caccae]|uniref:WxL domain surface protein n=1 Tax=Enterococcus caccae ATCC BAA-1240 TaxID=1158612 RepID=R3TMY9_9ENTE|nr:WxL domain-containing protein [Enterococcus caccae]EOL42874.1 WxL domain surface protein [Enterococcus caccae ATCC BAA-1240]EOT67647.1 WxL domain surface protein [Enterococcus caccae ATCC BAA-1240]OJG24037.1 WxL domain surface protein [Enterococcus caccae]
MKIILGSLATVAIVSSFVFVGGTVGEAVAVGSLTSNADISFSQDTTITPPVDPTDPTSPVTPNPGDPHQPGTGGPLSLDYVSNFHFGTKVIQAADATYYAQLDQVQNSLSTLISVPNYAQVTDKRGLNLGWKLTVKQNGQFQTADTTPAVLTNAQMSMVAATPNSTELIALAPLTVPVTLDPTGAASSPVATAAVSTGMGTWTLAFGSGTGAAQGVKLTVPNATTKLTNNQYKTTLTWTLNDSPL